MFIDGTVESGPPSVRRAMSIVGIDSVYSSLRNI
jgi:hypothetical protein